MGNRQTKPGVASEWPGFPSAAIAAIPLDGIDSLVETATNLAVPGSHTAPVSIDDLTEAAATLAPPDPPVGGSEGDASAQSDAEPGGGIPPAIDASFPSAAVVENPLDGIDALVEIATNLATPGSHAAPDNIDALIAAATALGPPDTPVNGGAGDSSITESGVRLGAGAVHANDPISGSSAEAGLEMTLDGEEVFLTTVGISSLPDAAL